MDESNNVVEDELKFVVYKTGYNRIPGIRLRTITRKGCKDSTLVMRCDGKLFWYDVDELQESTQGEYNLLVAKHRGETGCEDWVYTHKLSSNLKKEGYDTLSDLVLSNESQNLKAGMLVAFRNDTGDICPGIVLGKWDEFGMFHVLCPLYDSPVLMPEDKLLVISASMYNHILQIQNRYRFEADKLPLINEAAYVQSNTLHPGDRVLIADGCEPAVVDVVERVNGIEYYTLIDPDGCQSDVSYHRNDLVHLSEKEWKKHLPRSSTYLDLLEDVDRTASRGLTFLDEPEFVSVRVDSFKANIPGIRISTYADGECNNCTTVLLYNKLVLSYQTNDVATITLREYENMVRVLELKDKTSYCHVLDLADILQERGHKPLAERLRVILKGQNMNDKNKDKTEAMFKVGDMVLWDYCTFNENEMPAYVRSARWDSTQPETYRYDLVMPNGHVMKDIDENALEPCEDEEYFDMVVGQTSGVLGIELMTWDKLCEYVKYMNNVMKGVENCSNGSIWDKYILQEDRIIKQRQAEGILEPYDSEEDEDEDDEEEEEEEEEEDPDEVEGDPETEPRVTVEEVVKRWMDKK